MYYRFSNWQVCCWAESRIRQLHLPTLSCGTTAQVQQMPMPLGELYAFRHQPALPPCESKHAQA
jgi:hypothetical protein